MIPGEELQTTESDLLQLLGKYLTLYEMEQRKRLILLQAYDQLQAELAGVKIELFELKNPDVVLGQP